MDTTADCYMYAGVRMVVAERATVLMVLGAGLQILGAIQAASGPIRAYLFAKSRRYPRLEPTMQDNAWSAGLGLVIVVCGNLLQFCTWWIERR